jgi:hypothetical protein
VLVRGPGAEMCRTYVGLVKRGLKAVAAAMVPGQAPADELAGAPRPRSAAAMTLVPGAGACEAGTYTRPLSSSTSFYFSVTDTLTPTTVSHKKCIR